MEKIKISEMKLLDLDSIKLNLEKDFDNFWNVNILKQEILNSSTKYIVAKDENEKILGFAGILINVDQVELMNIVVEKDKRNQGIGQKLLKRIIEISKQSGLEILSLEVNSNNKFAIKLYEKNGFKMIGKRKKYYNNQDDAIIMNLNLKSK